MFVAFDDRALSFKTSKTLKKMKSNEIKTEHLEMLSYWFEQLTGKTLEQEASDKEITVDYLVMEFL